MNENAVASSQRVSGNKEMVASESTVDDGGRETMVVRTVTILVAVGVKWI